MEEGEEEEVQIAQRLKFEEVSIDQDLDFIEDDITNFYTVIQQKDPVLSHVQKAIEKGKRKIPENLKDIMISEVKNLEENFQKVISYSCKYKKQIEDVHRAVQTWLGFGSAEDIQYLLHQLQQLLSHKKQLEGCSGSFGAVGVSNGLVCLWEK